LIGGIAEMDVDDWKKHTDYRGYTESDDVVQWFWKVSCFFLKIPDVGNTVMGCREEVQVIAIYNWNIKNSCQRL
jgi:HECT-domain (ubiquitin-transferase)